MPQKSLNKKPRPSIPSSKDFSSLSQKHFLPSIIVTSHHESEIIFKFTKEFPHTRMHGTLVQWHAIDIFLTAMTRRKSSVNFFHIAHWP